MLKGWRRSGAASCDTGPLASDCACRATQTAGHPEMIVNIKHRLKRKAAQATRLESESMSVIISQPRGVADCCGHASHQMGLTRILDRSRLKSLSLAGAA